MTSPEPDSSRWIRLEADPSPSFYAFNRSPTCDPYQQFWERSNVGMYRAGVDGRFLEVNPAYAHLLGYGSARSLIEHVTCIAQEIYKSPTRWRELLTYLQYEDSVQGFESPILNAQGQIIWVTESIQLVNDDENGRYILEGVVHNITDRKQREIDSACAQMKRDRLWLTFWQQLEAIRE